MNRLKFYTIHFLSILVVLYVSFLASGQLIASSLFCDNDFKTFSVSLLGDKSPYEIRYYVWVLHSEKKDNKIVMKTSAPISMVNMNTPLMNLFMKKLLSIYSRLNFTVFTYIVCSLIFASVSMVMLLRYFSLPCNYVFPCLGLFWLSWPSLYALKLGQISFFVLPFLVFPFLLLEKRAYFVIAVLLGLLASLKLFFLIFLLFFLTRAQWRLSIVFVLSFLFFFFLPLFYFHWSDYQAFFLVASKHELFLQRSFLPVNGSLLGFVAHMTSLFHFAPSQYQLIFSATALCLYVIIRYVIYDCFFLQKLPDQADALRFSFLIVIALLCSPLGWLYYFIFLIIPFMTVIKISQRYVISKWLYVFLINALLLLFFPFIKKTVGFLGFIAQFSMLMSLICCLFVLIVAARAVNCGVLIDGENNQPNWLVSIFVFYVLWGFILLSFNYGMPYFLNPDKTNYFKQTARVFWLSDKNKIIKKAPVLVPKLNQK